MTEYKDALDAVKVLADKPHETELEFYQDFMDYYRRFHAVNQRALRIAHALMQEPSEGMKKAWLDQDRKESNEYWSSGCSIDRSKPWNSYKAMRDQLLKEVEND